MKKKAVCVMLAMSMVLTACGTETATEEAAADIVAEVTKPEMGSIQVMGEFMGTLEPEEETSVAAKMSGEITETFFEVGDHVEKGDVLFTLNDEAAKLQLETAQNTYQSAVSGATQQVAGIDLQRANNDNTVATADESIKSVLNNCDYLSDTSNDIQNQINDMEDNKSDLEKAMDSANSYLKKVSTVNTMIGKLTSLADEYAAAAAVDPNSEEAQRLKAEYNGYFSQITGGSTTDDPSAPHYSEYNSYIAEKTGNPTLTIDSLAGELTTAKGNANSASSAYSSLESGINSLESQKDNLNNSKQTAATSYSQAVRGRDLAQKSADYYNNYTAPGTQTSAAITMKTAELGVESAQLQLDYTKVTAPVSGTIESKNVDQFGMAQAGAAAYVITNKDNMIVNFKVSETVMKTLKENQEVIIDRNGTEYKGYISEIPLTLDAASGLFKIKAIVESNSAELISGTSVKITTGTDHVENSMMIPIDAVYYEGEKAYVYTVEGSIMKKTYVTVGIFDDTNIEIVEGLNADSQVVTSWSSQYRDGLEVVTNQGVSGNSAVSNNETVSSDTAE